MKATCKKCCGGRRWRCHRHVVVCTAVAVQTTTFRFKKQKKTRSSVVCDKEKNNPSIKQKTNLKNKQTRESNIQTMLWMVADGGVIEMWSFVPPLYKKSFKTKNKVTHYWMTLFSLQVRYDCACLVGFGLI